MSFNSNNLNESLLSYGMSQSEVASFMKDYDQLTDSDKSLFIYETLGKDIYKTYPVDMHTFIHDPYYLGTIYSECIFPKWDHVLSEIYPAPLTKRYNEVLLSLATRVGKSTVTAISALYEMYLITCMVNPARTLAGKSTASLVFCILSKDNPTACSQVGSDLYKGLSLSPYFQSATGSRLSFSNLDKKGVAITDSILLKAGSTINVITGTDLIFGCLDEANMPSPRIAASELVEYRLKMYKSMLDRQRETFKAAPAMTGIIWMTSSPMDEGDPIGERILEVKANGVPNVFIMDNVARWEIKPEETKDTFDFYLGSDTKDPCIVETTDLDINTLEPEKIIKVPRTMEYYNNFKTDTRRAIQEIAGRRTNSESALFNSVAVFEKVFHKKNVIFTSDELKINLKDMSRAFEDYLYDKDYFRRPFCPECYRYIHLDIASKHDRFGMSSVYANRVTYTAPDGSEVKIKKYFIDFCLGVSAMNNDPVDILRVLKFIYGLKKLGYPIKKVTTDSHQGELARQIIYKHGIATEYASVENSTDAYYNLKNLVLSETLEGFNNPNLIKELRGLRVYSVNGKEKIHKSKGYTDDLSDSLAAALLTCSRDDYYKKTNDTVMEAVNTIKFDNPNLNINGLYHGGLN